MIMRKYARFAFIGLLILGLFCGGTMGAALNANFSANITSGTAPLSVYFTDMSTNATSWEWDVGNGTYTTQNVTHTYTTAGTYTVTLKAINQTSNDTEIKNNYITVSALTMPVANFSTNVTSGDVPLTVEFTDTSTNATSWSWDVGNGTYATQNVTHTYTNTGTYTVTLTATNPNGTDIITKTNHITVSGLVPIANFSANITSGVVPLTVNFTDESTNVTSWSWDVGNGTYASQNVTHTYTTAGTYTVTLTATNPNGTDIEIKNNYITVSALTMPIADFSTNVTEGTVPLTVKFTDLSTNTTSWSWDVGDRTYASQNVTHTYNNTGTYTVNLTVTNPNGTDKKTITINVHPKTYYTGDRIWDELTSPSPIYTWNAMSFSGFYYDLDSGKGSESMKITLNSGSRSVGDGKLEYTTKPINTDFEHTAWGSYQVIGFMAENYFAGYPSGTFGLTSSVSVISNGQLSKVLMNEDEKHTFYAGSALVLEDGYTLNVVEVDKNGDKVFVTLTKDGTELDSTVVSSNDDYVYETDIGSADNVPMIVVHFENIFQGSETSAVFVRGIFQISDDYVTVRSGDNYGKMRVDSVNANEIKMSNDNSFSLSGGKTIDIMGKIKLLVADSGDIRFAPFVDMTEPGTYELRGTVTEDTHFKWTPFNFEGFYYNMDDGIATESLEVTSSGRSINTNNLIYTAKPDKVSFEHTSSSGWGTGTGYNVVGFMAENYFAGYPQGAFDTTNNAISLISDGQLSKVLINEDKSRAIHSGAGLILDEGYVLNIIEIDRDGGKVAVSLSKDGSVVDDLSIVTADDTYVYEKDLGSSDKIPIIAVHFDEIFQGRETNAVFVDGIFQISDQHIAVDVGDTFGKMEVKTVDSTNIVMKNDNSISLSRGKSIPIMGNIQFKVADDLNKVRYYPFVEVETAPHDSLDISMPTSVKLGDYVSIIVTSRGATVSSVIVKFDDDKVGTTSNDGTLTYKPALAGTYTVTVEKEGYVSASGQVEIISPLDETKKMSIEVSPDTVYEGNQLMISTIKSIGGEAIDGVDVSYDGNSLGTTSSDGTIAYTVKEPGMHKLTATKTGFLDAEFNLKVLALEAKFEFSNLVVSPLEVKTGKDVTITLDASNTGKAAGDYNVDLMLNGNLTDSQQITLDVDESTTIEFTVAKEEPGTYLVEVNGLSGTFEVLEKSGGVALYVLGILSVFAAAAVGYMFTAGGWTVEMVSAKVAEFIESVR